MKVCEDEYKSVHEVQKACRSVMSWGTTIQYNLDTYWSRFVKRIVLMSHLQELMLVPVDTGHCEGVRQCCSKAEMQQGRDVRKNGTYRRALRSEIVHCPASPYANHPSDVQDPLFPSCSGFIPDTGLLSRYMFDTLAERSASCSSSRPPGRLRTNSLFWNIVHIEQVVLGHHCQTDYDTRVNDHLGAVILADLTVSALHQECVILRDQVTD